MVTVRRGKSFVVGPDFDAEEEAGAFVVEPGEAGEEETIEAGEFHIEIGREDLFAMRPPYRAGWEEVPVPAPELEVDFPFECEAKRRVTIRTPVNEEGDPENPAIVYYPSTRGGEGAEPRRGPFPVIGFAHGHRYPCSADFLCEDRPRDEEADATAIGQDYRQWGHMLKALASWGFVVVAPDLHWIIDRTGAPAGELVAQRGDAVNAALGWVRGSWPHRSIVRREPERIGLLGHSFGGRTVLALAAQELAAESAVGAIGLIGPALLRPAAPLLDPLARDRVALLFMLGTNEETVTEEYLREYWWREEDRPKYLVVLDGANHWGYTTSILECEDGARFYDPGRVRVLRVPGSVEQEQRAQQQLASHFVVMFFRKHLLGAAIPDDLLNAELVASRPEWKEPTVEGGET